MPDYVREEKTKGRPRLVLTEDGLEAVEKLSAMMCTEEEISSMLDISVDTFHRKHNQKAFMERKEKGMNKGKASLRRMQYKAAEAGNSTMQIWLGKQYLEQTDKQETSLMDANISFEIVPASGKDK